MESHSFISVRLKTDFLRAFFSDSGLHKDGSDGVVERSSEFPGKSLFAFTSRSMLMCLLAQELKQGFCRLERGKGC